MNGHLKRGEQIVCKQVLYCNAKSNSHLVLTRLATEGQNLIEERLSVCLGAEGREERSGLLTTVREEEEDAYHAEEARRMASARKRLRKFEKHAVAAYDGHMKRPLLAGDDPASEAEENIRMVERYKAIEINAAASRASVLDGHMDQIMAAANEVAQKDREHEGAQLKETRARREVVVVLGPVVPEASSARIEEMEEVESVDLDLEKDANNIAGRTKRRREQAKQMLNMVFCKV